MPHCYVTRQLDLGEPLELDIRVDYHYTNYGAPAITSGPADNWDPGWGAEIFVDDVTCDIMSPLRLLSREYDQVLDHANEYASAARYDAEADRVFYE